MQEFTIDISETGDVTVAGKGVAGPDCEKLTREIEEACGTVTKRVRTPEYHQRPGVTRKVGA